jgi:hypothetical protein
VAKAINPATLQSVSIHCEGPSHHSIPLSSLRPTTRQPFPEITHAEPQIAEYGSARFVTLIVP